MALSQEQIVAFRDEREKNFSPMPAFFWPVELKIVGTYYGGVELGFSITREEFEDNLTNQVFGQRLQALRESLWQLAKWPQDNAS